jgi:hypothetical protein
MVARGRAISVLQREQLCDVLEFDRSEGWRGEAAVSMAAWLMQNCGVASSTASIWVRTATNLETLPALAAGLASGSLSLDLVAPLSTVATPRTDAPLAAEALHLSVKQAKDLVAWHVALRDQAAGSGYLTASRDYDRRTLRFNDDRCTMWVPFTMEDYAEVKGTLVALVQARDGEGDKSGHAADPLGYVPYDQRLYDALVDLLRAGGGSKPATASARPKMVIHAPLELLLGIRDAGVAEIQGVGPVPAEVARRLACDANIDVLLEQPDGTVLDQGRVRRHPTTAQRLEIARRDNGCRFPTCPYCDFTHVHHMVHWNDGGATDQNNLITLCGRHHRAVHELGWTMEGDPDGAVSFTSPQGRTVSSVPSPTWRRPVPKRETRAPTRQKDGPLRR